MNLMTCNCYVSYKMVAAISIIGWYDTTGIISIVDEIHITCLIGTLIVITINVYLKLEFLTEGHVNLCHRRIATAGCIIDDIILIRIAYRRIVSHFFRTSRYAYAMILRQ